MWAALPGFMACMTCLLCSKDEMLTKAHIMPDSMNRELRKVLGDDPNSPMLTIEKATGQTKRYPMGTYDKTIICGPCDGSFSPWEKHATDILFAEHAWADLTLDGSQRPVCYTLMNAEYKSLKLFVLSMLWKTSVSTQKFCAGVNLPVATVERLRTMLLAGDPGSARDFPVRICQFYNMDVGISFESHEETIDGLDHVVMYLPGYKLLVKVDQKRVPLDPIVITPDSPVLVRLLNFQGSPERRAVEKMAALI